MTTPNGRLTTLPPPAQPARSCPPLGEEAARELLKPRGCSRVQFPKERVTIRLSHEVLEHFKASGDGWQTRIDAALRESVGKELRRKL